MFQKVSNHTELDMKTKVPLISYLASIQGRGFDLKRLSFHEIAEQKFTTSATDLAYNLIGIRRARRAERLAHIGYPLHRNLSVFYPVSDSKFGEVLRMYDSGAFGPKYPSE